MPKPRILISWPLPAQFMTDLDSRFEFVALDNGIDRYRQTFKLIPDFDGLIAINLKVDRPLLKAAKILKAVSNCSVGYDNTDITAAKALNVMVTNTPNSTARPTAEMAMILILNCLRRTVEFDRMLRAKEIPNWHGPQINGHSIEGKTLGILGLGNIGKVVAQMAAPFKMKLIYYNRNRLSPEEENTLEVSYRSFDEIIAESDVLSIHTPLNDGTQGLIGINEFNNMKTTAHLVNTARGGVIDQIALINALQNGQIAGAGLDVFVNEPNISDELLTLPNVVLSPHAGTSTFEARSAMMQEAMYNIMAALSGGDPTSVVC